MSAEFVGAYKLDVRPIRILWRSAWRVNVTGRGMGLLEGGGPRFRAFTRERAIAKAERWCRGHAGRNPAVERVTFEP